MNQPISAPGPRPRPLGILSLVFAAINPVLLLCAFGYYGAAVIGRPLCGPQTEELVNVVNLATAVAAVSMVLAVAAAVLGILSLRAREPRRGFAIAGLVLDGLFVFGCAAPTALLAVFGEV